MDKNKTSQQQKNVTKRVKSSVIVTPDDYPPPPVYFREYGAKKLTRTEKLKLFIYDPKTRKVFGRTGPSWGKLGIFYAVYFVVLSSMFAICMFTFFQTLDPRQPKYILERSIVGTNPGLGFRPTPPGNEQSALIWFQGSNRTNYMMWNNLIIKFLDKYYKRNKINKSGRQMKTCSYNDYPDARFNEVCEVDPRDWGECNKEQYFNYHKNSPCVFIKLNRIYGWVPEYYDNPHDLPEDMPRELKKHIISINNTLERKNVWVSCTGEDTADLDHIGPISYYPRGAHGFPGFYFPYTNAEGYLSPLVAVRFDRPTSGVLINIECRAWAKNIKYKRRGKMGSVHLELMIDK